VNPKTIKRIVVATDFSELSAEVIDTAVAFARDSGATVDLVHVTAEMAYAVPPPMDVIQVPVDVSKVMAEATARLDEAQERVRALGLVCEGSLLVGRADTEIVEHAAKTKADLIILGTHGRSGLGHALLGSIAEKVVQHAHCPVLTLPMHQR